MSSCTVRVRDQDVDAYEAKDNFITDVSNQARVLVHVQLNDTMDGFFSFNIKRLSYTSANDEQYEYHLAATRSAYAEKNADVKVQGVISTYNAGINQIIAAAYYDMSSVLVMTHSSNSYIRVLSKDSTISRARFSPMYDYLFFMGQ